MFLLPGLLVGFNFCLLMVYGAIHSGEKLSISPSFDNIIWVCVIVNLTVLAIYALFGALFAIISISIELTRWIRESIREKLLLRRSILYIFNLIIFSIGSCTVIFALIMLAELIVTKSNVRMGTYEPSGTVVSDRHAFDEMYELIFAAALTLAIFTVAIALRLRIPWNGDRARPTVAMVSDAGRIVADVVVRAANRSAGGRNDRPVFHGSERRAQEAAAGRRQFVAGRSLEYRRGRPTTEILEIPPPLRGSVELRTLSEEDADATIVRLLYHRDDKALLFDRVVESVVSFGRDRGISLVSGTEIVLRSLHWWERLQGEYGWIAQVRTDHPNEISQFLASIRDWLGIGVRTARPAGWAAQRRCVYSGDVGTVAGRTHDKGFHDKLLPNLRSRRPSSLRPGEADQKIRQARRRTRRCPASRP